MRTRILSLLLALLAISNFSFAQNKHFIHSIPFKEATQKMYGEDDKQNLVFQPEKIGSLKPSDKLVTFLDEDFKNGKIVKFGMLMDQQKHDILLHEFTDGNNVQTHDYIWVFNWDDFEEKCQSKKIGEFKLKFDHFFYFFKENEVNKGYSVVERLSQLMGIDKFPEHIYLCEFEVKLDKQNIFRPTYQPDVTKKEMTNCFYDNKWHLDTEYFKGWNINSSHYSIKYLSPEQWLASLQQSKEYPWTRMGYTYDWGDSDHVGVSEFILVPNTELLNVKFYEILK